MSQQQYAQEATTDLNHRMRLDIYSNPHSVRKTSIICTISDRTNSVELLTNLRKAGMNIVRLNLSHASREAHSQTLANLAESILQHAEGRVVGVAVDTQGRAIRTGSIKDNREFELPQDSEVTLTVNPAHADATSENLIFVDNPLFVEDVSFGSVLSFDTGLSLKVTEKNDDDIKVRVVSPGKLVSRHEIYRQDGDNSMPILTTQDREGLQWAIENEIDMVFASSVRTPSDVNEVREMLGIKGQYMRVIAKITNRAGLDNFDEILKVADGIMISRGALAMDILPEKVFVAQKMMIAKCNLAGKPVICATQMLDSMVLNPRPTRAETSDVANAVLDGADCVMLAGETAKGLYPVEAVQTMANVCTEAECAVFRKTLSRNFMQTLPGSLNSSLPIALAVTVAANNCQASAIVTLTTSGDSARIISKFRPQCPILAVSRVPYVLRQIHLHSGCYPLYYSAETAPTKEKDIELRVDFAMEEGKRSGFLKPGDRVVLAYGWLPKLGHNVTDFRIVTVQ